MATADKGPEERKQEREANLVGRDKASSETVDLITSQLSNIDDPEAAKAIAMLNEQINDTKPPAEVPFNHWHRDLDISLNSVVSTTSTGATVEVELTEYEFYDDPVDIHARFSERDPDSIDITVIETPNISVPSESTLDKVKGLFTISGSSDDSNIVETISTDSLEPDTEYNVRVVGEVPHELGTDVEYSDSITFTTDPS